ncbi:hypothetical protein GCM10023221_04360 [Luteimicrobium xylanilyticum]|uniref:DNA repair protein RadA like protein n=1 Tax=Luteimicrobium xylanilyticum TaxID=1133546 RepID=A0A5P9Q784_9MICO|nr:AAA family ATPase [Luteimicrobium xylanilyticum]QFU97271.1 hypothetical protein KDY119_00765 [Luteimicrobium xylanilyticum]
MNDLERVGRERGCYFTADQLLDTEFPDPRWAVEGLIPEGLTLLAGAPKLGKSWLALGIGISIAAGGYALGSIETAPPADVLYLALEDTPRRLKSRLTKMLAGEPAPRGLTIMTQMPSMPQATELIAGWLDEHRDARLVVVDVLGKIRPSLAANADRYDADYKVISALKQIADNYGIAIVAVTHVRKMADGDVFNTVSGSTGLTGAADTTLVLRRARGEHGASLHITGRDVEENEYALTFAPETGTWTLDGTDLHQAAERVATNKAVAGVSDDMAAVIELVNSKPEGVRAGDVATALGWPSTKATTYLNRACDQGRISKPGRGLFAAGVMSVSSVSSAEVLDFERHTNNRHHTPGMGA